MVAKNLNLVHISSVARVSYREVGNLDIELVVGLEHIYVVSSLALEVDNQLDFN